MAGNTRLLGFTAGNHVILHRWGQEVLVEASPSSTEALLNACSELPKKPPKREFTGNSAHFDPELGIVLVIDPNRALVVAGSLPDDVYTLVRDAHEDYLDWKDTMEPGVEDEP